MLKTIQQRVVFKNTTTAFLYELYMDAKLHQAVTGADVKISKKAVAAFSAYDGYCYGINLQLLPNRLIVQSWRASDWMDDDLDSTLILQFEQQGNDVVLSMVHANVKEEQAKSIQDGWNQFYWKPWKEYLKSSKQKN